MTFRNGKVICDLGAEIEKAPSPLSFCLDFGTSRISVEEAAQKGCAEPNLLTI